VTATGVSATGIGTRRCPACQVRTAAPGKLMCRRCWGKVPPALQKNVYATWRKWSRDLGDADAKHAYQAASAAAVAVV
jgi:hypothetical protein